MNKNELREILIKKRKTIENKKELSHTITNKILKLKIYQKAKVIALYKNMKMEVDTSYLIREALKEKTVLLPRVIGDNMVFIKINQDTKYIKSEYGIMEPIGEVYKGIIDLIIVPGIAFDLNKNRLGFGKGYYDKYLNNKDIYKIGICFDEQIVDYVPTNELDIKMDMVITNKKRL